MHAISIFFFCALIIIIVVNYADIIMEHRLKISVTVNNIFVAPGKVVMAICACIIIKLCH